MEQYVALLRGINVGGNNKIKMTDLKDCFEAAGFTDVVTYIQSGNVIFTGPRASEASIAEKLEQTLSKTFSYGAKVVIVTKDTLRQVVNKAPRGFGTKPKDFRYYVIFIKKPLTASEALQAIPLREEVDQAWAGPTVVYHERVEARASQSYLNKLVAMPMYQNMTIRNWNTTTKLLALMEKPKA